MDVEKIEMCAVVDLVGCGNGNKETPVKGDGMKGNSKDRSAESPVGQLHQGKLQAPLGSQPAKNSIEQLRPQCGFCLRFWWVKWVSAPSSGSIAITTPKPL